MATVIERASNITKMVTFPRPDFNLSKLEPGTHYSIKLYAENKIGEQSFWWANFISKLWDCMQQTWIVLAYKNLPFLSTFHTVWLGSWQNRQQLDAKIIRISAFTELIEWIWRQLCFRRRASHYFISRHSEAGGEEDSREQDRAPGGDYI